MKKCLEKGKENGNTNKLKGIEEKFIKQGNKVFLRGN